MKKNISQSEIKQQFDSITRDGIQVAERKDFTDEEMYQHLLGQGYSPEAILGMFGLSLLSLTAADVQTIKEMRQDEIAFAAALETITKESINEV